MKFHFFKLMLFVSIFSNSLFAADGDTKVWVEGVRAAAQEVEYPLVLHGDAQRSGPGVHSSSASLGSGDQGCDIDDAEKRAEIEYDAHYRSRARQKKISLVSGRVNLKKDSDGRFIFEINFGEIHRYKILNEKHFHLAETCGYIGCEVVKQDENFEYVIVKEANTDADVEIERSQSLPPHDCGDFKSDGKQSSDKRDKLDCDKWPELNLKISQMVEDLTRKRSYQLFNLYLYSVGTKTDKEIIALIEREIIKEVNPMRSIIQKVMDLGGNCDILIELVADYEFQLRKQRRIIKEIISEHPNLKEKLLSRKLTNEMIDDSSLYNLYKDWFKEILGKLISEGGYGRETQNKNPSEYGDCCVIL